MSWQVLGGRYEMGDVLGRGGMAEVHRAHDVRLGRTVAVKTLRSDLARDPSFQARFRREAQSAASLNHPSVVAVYDTGEDQVTGAHGERAALPYIVMELVEGSTLRELLSSGRRLLPDRALEITAGVLAALAYSHRNGIVHRDIKPANVMLTRSGEVKVMDFGIARSVADPSATMTQTAAVIGTAQYLSPEQARGETADARSDLYSTGCLLYELLTGRPPFVGDSPVSVAYQHVREDVTPPSALDPELSPEIDSIVLKALAKNPDNRYQTADEMRDDLERAIAGLPVAATPLLLESTQRIAHPAATTVTPADPRRRSGRRGLVYLLLALLLIGLVVAAALVLRAALDDPPAKPVHVPNLVGSTQAQAESKLGAVNLKLDPKLSREYSAKQPEGRVIDQNPESGQTLKPGGTVHITLSRGVRQATVPNVIGRTRKEAKQALEKLGLTVGTVTPQDTDTGTRAGEVLDTDPVVGEQVKTGTRVDLIVASGRQPVPDVVGSTEANARDTLESNNFTVVVRREISTSEAPGTVIDQTPNGGKRRDVGSTVTIVVASAPSPTPSATPTTTSPSPPPTSTAPPTTPAPTTTAPTTKGTTSSPPPTGAAP